MASAEPVGTRQTFALCFALASAGSGALPPPPQQAGADCARPTYASDWQVCGDAALRALDGQVHEAWRMLATRTPALDPSAWVESQEAWFRRRSLCAFLQRHAECLRAAYGERAAVLEAWRLATTGASAGAGLAVRCAGAPWGAAAVVARRDDTGVLTVTDMESRLLAIALPEAMRDDWQPFLRFAADGAGFRLLTLDGPGASCATR